MEQKKENKKGFFKEMAEDIGIFPNYLFLLLAIAIVIAQLIPLTQFKHIPGPPYGGDLYRERGFTQHILNGEPFYSDPYIQNEYAFYPTLGYVLAAILKIISGLSLDSSLIYFSFLLTPLFFLAAYMLGKELFREKALVLLTSASFFVAVFFISMKHTVSLGILMALFFLVYFLRINKREEKFFSKNKLMAGIFLGLAALSHYTTFISVVVIILSTIFFEGVYSLAKKKDRFFNVLKAVLIRHAFFIIVGFIISLFFFYPIIFKYHFSTPNPTNSYSLQDVNKLGVSWLLSKTLSHFFIFSSWPYFIIGIITLLGLVLSLMNFKRIDFRLALFWFIGAFLATGHYLITKPLFDFSIVPAHVASAHIYPVFLFFPLGVQFILLMINKFSGKEEVRNGFFILLFIVLIFGLLQESKDFNNDQWTRYGKTMDAGTIVVYQIGDWLLKNTKNEDVFLANDESSFMLNGMSGRSVVLTRRVHASAYVDMERRYAEGIAMLYCKNSSISRQLLTDYNVTYLYVDQFLIGYPIVANMKYSNLFDSCEINYSVQNVPLDTGGPNSPLYLSLVVPPQNLTVFSFVETPPKQFMIGNQLYSELYSINN